MRLGKKIKVLVVDDSMFFREVLCRGLLLDEEIETVVTANDPFDARDKIIKYRPDVMTCDVEMPKMNGIEFIRRLLPQYPLPVVVVSGVNGIVFDALNVGAVDFIAKPGALSAENVEAFVYDLIDKVKVASKAHIIRPHPVKPKTLAVSENQPVNHNIKTVIAIGASTGGIEAITSILTRLDRNMPPIVITQHIPPGFSKIFADRLNEQTCFCVKEASQGEMLEPGKVLIAPGNQHMQIKKVSESYKVILEQGERVNGHCPSVDVLFQSVAKECKAGGIGIILTGMGYDGAKGLLAMRRAGAKTIGQSEASCVVYGMPKVAFELGAVEKQCPLERIPQLLYSMLQTKT